MKEGHFELTKTTVLIAGPGAGAEELKLAAWLRAPTGFALRQASGYATTHCYFDYAQGKGPNEPECIGGFLPLAGTMPSFSVASKRT